MYQRSTFRGLFADEDLLQGIQTALRRLLPALAGPWNQEPVVIDANRVTADLVDAITLSLVWTTAASDAATAAA